MQGVLLPGRTQPRLQPVPIRPPVNDDKLGLLSGGFELDERSPIQVLTGFTVA